MTVRLVVKHSQVVPYGRDSEHGFRVLEQRVFRGWRLRRIIVALKAEIDKYTVLKKVTAQWCADTNTSSLECVLGPGVNIRPPRVLCLLAVLLMRRVKRFQVVKAQYFCQVRNLSIS